MEKNIDYFFFVLTENTKPISITTHKSSQCLGNLLLPQNNFNLKSI